MRFVLFLRLMLVSVIVSWFSYVQSGIIPDSGEKSTIPMSEQISSMISDLTLEDDLDFVMKETIHDQYFLSQHTNEKDFGRRFIGVIPEERFFVTQKTWEQKQNDPANSENENIKDQFQTDIVLWCNTMFRKSLIVGGRLLDRKSLMKFEETQNFLKRLFLLMAYAPMEYVTKNNASSRDEASVDYQKPLPFAFPLASALSHGQRILMTLIDNQQIGGMDSIVYNLLLSGDFGTRPIIDELRSFASHGVSRLKNGRLFEDKLKIGFMGAIRCDHHMVNIPMGGIANINELGYFIGPQGESYQMHEPAIIDKYQLGHVFIAAHRFSGGVSSLLVGVESTAPHKISPFLTGGKKHTILSGLKDSTTNRSATGGQKWEKLLGDAAPATYGGMLLTIRREDLGGLKAVFDKILAMPEKEQSIVFLELLSMNALEANHFLRFDLML